MNHSKKEIAEHLIKEIQYYRENPHCWNSELDFKSVDAALMVCQNIITTWSESKMKIMNVTIPRTEYKRMIEIQTKYEALKKMINKIPAIYTHWLRAVIEE